MDDIDARLRERQEALDLLDDLYPELERLYCESKGIWHKPSRRLLGLLNRTGEVVLRERARAALDEAGE